MQTRGAGDPEKNRSPDLGRSDDGLDRRSANNFGSQVLTEGSSCLSPLRLLDNRAVESPQLYIYTKNIYVSRWLV
jgi:hypothetical protein